MVKVMEVDLMDYSENDVVALYRARATRVINGNMFKIGELVEMTHINVEVGKRSIITFKNMRNFVMGVDSKTFFDTFELDVILNG